LRNAGREEVCTHGGPTHRPSVHRAASVEVITAVPALPVNPETKARRSSQAATYSLCEGRGALDIK
jgi:hypothetical protein